MAAFGEPDIDQAASAVERFDCPTCAAPAGSPCRTAGGNTAFRYHTPRFMVVPALQDRPEVLVPKDRGPGRPWQAPQPAVAAAEPGKRTGAIRIGYASSGIDRHELREQIKALEGAGCERIFFERVDALAKARPELAKALEAALDAARSPGGRAVLVTTNELRHVARNSTELMASAATLQSGGVRLEVLAGPLAGIHDPDGPEPTLFAVLAAAARLDREHGRQRILAGQRAAEARGRRSGRPRVFDDELLARARELRDAGVPVPEIAARLVITTGKNTGGHPSVASVYRALAEADAALEDSTTAPEPTEVN